MKATAGDVLAVCDPKAGWHLPSEDEFQQLYDLSCSVNDVSPDFTCYSLRDRDWKNGGNITGFGALPAGYRIDLSGEECFEEFEKSALKPSIAMSVRCIKDPEN